MPKPSRAETRWSEAPTGFLEHLAAEVRCPHTVRNDREDLLAFTGWFVKRYGQWPKPGEMVPSELRE